MKQEEEINLSKRFEIYRRLIGYLKPYPRYVLLAYISMLFGVAFNLVVPQIIKQAIDQGLEAGEINVLVRVALLILGAALIRIGAGFGHMYLGEWLSHRTAYDLRNAFYTRVQELPFTFHDKAHTGDLMSRATSDISETERFAGLGLMDLAATFLLLSGVIVAMLLEDAQLALLALLPMPILIYATIRFGTRVRVLFQDLQAQMGEVSKTMQESLTGIGVVKAFARESHEMAKFDEENDEWFEQRVEVIQEWANNWPFFTFLVASSVFILLWMGGPKALAGQITVGTLYAMISYVLMLSGPVQRLGFLVNLSATSVASASRIFEIIDKPNQVADLPTAQRIEAVSGEVRFEDVDFRYQPEGPLILKGINFEVKPGQRIALVGSTGSGKSTLTNLIPRFYPLAGGRILVDGVDIRELAIADLRKQIGIVLQSSFLFSATIGENIAYGRLDATKEEIREAARAARADDFIQRFANGYETVVGERGVTLSGGQKQRVAIARALLRDPRILILDDSTSSVDSETEFLIQQALDILMEGRTTFVIAQRLSTLKQADLILVLDKGEIVERGTHDRLLEDGGLYRELYDLQLRDQEEISAADGASGQIIEESI